MDRIVSFAPQAVASAPLPQDVGIGLKPQHYEAILDPRHPAGRPGWVEVHPQNYFGDGGPPHRWLAAIAETYPISFHSVGLSLGSADGLMADHLERLVVLCQRYQPAMVSDHLSFSGNAHHRFADLLPLPYTQDMLDHFARQVDRVQQRLGRPMLIENPSCYLAYAHNDMAETDFLMALTRRTGCGLLLDINNIVVSTCNLGGAARDWLERIDPDVVAEIHLAGHATESHESGPLYIDDHGSMVGDSVWTLYAEFIAAHGAKPTLIEWDTDVPDYAVLMGEVRKARDLNPSPRGTGDHARQGGRVPSAACTDDLRTCPSAAQQAPALPFTGRNAQASFIATINTGPGALDPTLFDGPADRVLLGLKTHANTISHSRLVALEETFPLTRNHLGEAEFNRLSRAFVETATAQTSDSNRIGAGFADFLCCRRCEQSVVELAHIEWSWLQSYHAADAGALGPSAIAGLAAEALLDFAVQWHPATYLVWTTAALSPQLPGLASAEAILVVRPGAEVRLLAVDGATANVALGCGKSATLGNLLALSAEQAGIADPSGPVLTLIGAGALVACEVDDVASPDQAL